MSKHTGTEATKLFYDQLGWKERDGRAVDPYLFGVHEDGPIRIELHEVHLERVRNALSRAGTNLSLLECGCGGNPEQSLLDLCSDYTGVDFSETGLEMAESKLSTAGVPHQLKAADVCNLPFEDGRFDAAYCAHMIYHITETASQAAAFQEVMRVIKPGGTAVFIVVNPRPLLFPVRLLKRLIADTPFVGQVADKLRPQPPLPYKPMPLRWMQQQLASWGNVEMMTYSLPTTAFNQRTSEYKGIGKQLWKAIRWLDLKYPKSSVYLGNYAQISVCKSK
ncbi:MAG: hypothetical protein BRC40_15100 [Cyanobacteria bacterium QH_8_48_120]|jgi:SAM-dependent methyltransferase|nr:MAG: hypothetical protein BRC34_16345 [Cyanobacteria bacterium QH_1_48_107]PSO58750.1 MAG: hypothetical protein BRC35_05240 [Cyanobacteria bacterium QH_10_48_56]PSO60701.1 MAG: hypothetical protein BRC39_09505 [Cyanobacteria bacterium QH_7_48_89]PSO62613.1 MAG: hypothetical protein BRC36_09715 [Cyanobacteria bacterium QH_2_48_84]PSO65183.1 MAG: hypothetical protein BRC38_09550 [Cyanobacteria bacterium QH_6_48_35]PSO69551.1 MAG: hypothetical protein BRC40_15100 [Cyanobacteria bacterium QH_8_